jgi:hypothetical protein
MAPSFPLIANLAAKGAVVGLALYPLADPDASHFAGKAMGIRAALYPACTLIIPAAWLAAGRPEPYPHLADTALSLPFALDAAGNVLGLFAIPGFDAFPHAAGWLFLTLAFGSAVAPLIERRSVQFAVALGFGATIDVLWELGEYTLMRSGSSGLQLTYENTIQDMAVSLLGAAIGAVLTATAFRPRPGTPARLFGWSRRRSSA